MVEPRKKNLKGAKKPAVQDDSDDAPAPFARLLFAKNLQETRVLVGITQTEIGKITGLTQPYLSNLERGKVTVSLDNAAALADALGVPLYTLLMPKS